MGDLINLILVMVKGINKMRHGEEYEIRNMIDYL